MSAKPRVSTRTAAPAVELVMAHCKLCRSRARCANVRGEDVPLCRLCAISMAQLIAESQRPTARPHAKPCTCALCWAFDDGQLGEVANHRLLDQEGHVLSNWAIEERARQDDAAARWRNLEVDND